jgi:hypothetical protein
MKILTLILLMVALNLNTAQAFVKKPENSENYKNLASVWTSLGYPLYVLSQVSDRVSFICSDRMSVVGLRAGTFLKARHYMNENFYEISDIEIVGRMVYFTIDLPDQYLPYDCIVDFDLFDGTAEAHLE